MLRLAIESAQEGLHPSEVVVTIKTYDGTMEQVALDGRLVEDNQIKAYAVIESGDNVLVELPRETTNGSWRVWVTKASVSLRDKVAA